MLKLILSNIKFILVKSDLLSVRFSLVIASMMWVAWLMTISGNPPLDDDIVSGYYGVLDQLPLVVWILVFFAHGSAELTLLVLKIKDRVANMIVTAYGAIIWSSVSILIFVSLMRLLSPPFSGATWIITVVAWWVFIRNCWYGDRN